ncbi:proline-rich protein PRCC [Belonocnema kinseyi]|uniref:proline-rich protein PRCC n=1 Tax=Belonocnema kinseyi TaxID=2817044 RepID=UPI00143E0EBF|nr:proline-rich protein PRCC [Belonocnema kinseyi]
MSLVAYGSSDESNDEEVISNQESEKSVKKPPDNVEIKQISKNLEVKEALQVVEEQIPEILTVKPRTHISLPTPKIDQEPKILDENNSVSSSNTGSEEIKINFNLLPQPRRVDVIEDEDEIPENNKEILFDNKNLTNEQPFEKTVKKEKVPVKISIPRLSDFKDTEEEKEKSRNKIQPSQKGTGLFAVLPPPRSERAVKSKPMVPRVLTKKPTNPKIPPKSPQISTDLKKTRGSSIDNKTDKKSTISSNYDSSSEDEETDKSPAMDFFSLTSSDEIQASSIPIADIVNETLKYSQFLQPKNIHPVETFENENPRSELELSDKTLVSNVMNLPKEEIMKKNKAEVGPKLPVPEQDYNVDSTGNVVFDEKAIEYLCGKRGVKRKNKEFEGVDIIEINGEDIKPDEREWLVKALTEEPVTRPVSSQGAGPSGQSKKKHQITYLAHQAKAMEVELKNKWAQNKMTRQQTQSKYGF